MKFKMGYKNKDDHLLDEMYTRQFFSNKKGNAENNIKRLKYRT